MSSLMSTPNLLIEVRNISNNTFSYYWVPNPSTNEFIKTTNQYELNDYVPFPVNGKWNADRAVAIFIHQDKFNTIDQYIGWPFSPYGAGNFWDINSNVLRTIKDRVLSADHIDQCIEILQTAKRAMLRQR